MTKAQIFLIENFKPTDDIDKVIKRKQISIYLHGDSYPEGEGVCRGVFYPIWLCSRTFLSIRYFDNEYLLARLTQYLSNIRDLECYAEKINVLGVGIVNEVMDTNYIYIVSRNGVYCYDSRDTLIKELNYI